MECFFDEKVPKETFGNDFLSPVMRLCEYRLQNNECPVESIISVFSSQTFQNQHEETAENRAIIKINGDSISGAQSFCDILSEMSFSGIESWGINKLTLPITYGRYHNPLAKAFQRELSKQGQKFSYLYECGSASFTTSMQNLARNYIDIETI